MALSKSCYLFNRCADRCLADLRGQLSKGFMESLGKMTVTGKTQVEGQAGEVFLPGKDFFIRGSQPKLAQVLMDRLPGLLVKDPAEVKRRVLNFRGNGLQG